MFKYSVVVALCFLATVNSYPARDNKNDDVEDVEFVPVERNRPRFPLDFDTAFARDPVVDTGYFPNPFGFRDYLGDILRQMNQRIHNLFRQLHELNETDVSSIGGFHIHGVDLSKAKNTSETEVVNGHKVTVNKTQYDNDDENLHFHIQVINVAPLDEDGTPNPNAEELTPSTPIEHDNRESIEEGDNEISRSREADNFDIETLDEVDKVPDSNTRNEWDNIETMENEGKNQKVIDLSNDILVNQYMADSGAPINPDAEFLDDIDMELQKKSQKYGVLIK